MSVISSAFRGMENRLNTAASLARQGSDVKGLTDGVRMSAVTLGADTGNHRMLEPFINRMREVAGAIDSGANVHGPLEGARVALGEAAAQQGVKLAGIRTASHAGEGAHHLQDPVGTVDGRVLDTLGNEVRGHGRGAVGNDGQGFDRSGNAVDSTPGYNDYSDLF